MKIPVLLAALVLASASRADVPRPAPKSAADGITVNGRKLSTRDLETIAAVEKLTGRAAVAGDYWYDDATGAVGKWGGPTLTFLAPGLGLGGPLPANASGGGKGLLTGVFINGRELHPLDVQGLMLLLGGPVTPGRWWVDGLGNAGLEGGPPVLNLLQRAQQQRRAGGGDNAYYRKGRDGDSTYVGKGCAAVNGSTGSGSDKRSYSVFVGCD